MSRSGTARRAVVQGSWCIGQRGLSAAAVTKIPTQHTEMCAPGPVACCEPGRPPGQLASCGGSLAVLTEQNCRGGRLLPHSARSHVASALPPHSGQMPLMAEAPHPLPRICPLVLI